MISSRLRSYAPISKPTRLAPAQHEASRYQLLTGLPRAGKCAAPAIEAAFVFTGENQVAAASAPICCAVKLQLGLRWVAARSNAEVIFQTALVSIKDQIDSGVNTLIANSGKLRNAGMPFPRVVAKDVVALAGQWIGPSLAAAGLAPTSFMRTTCSPSPADRLHRENGAGWSRKRLYPAPRARNFTPGSTWP